MITTVTTVTTVTTIAALGLTGVLSIASVVLLMLFLTTKELAGASGSGFSLRMARFVSVGILPLVMAFAVIVVMKVVEVIA
jgi:hypothetical protein|tara:strand:- start:92 stop:334 length:243 start_codon:yes stop_codon:yes gene_type:complete